MGWKRCKKIKFLNRGETAGNFLENIRKYGLIPEENRNADLESDIKGYFRGEIKKFTAKINIKGTNFQKKVWYLISKIPYGDTRSYKDIGRALGNKYLARAAGNAAGMNPVPLIIPCHRVIRSDGSPGGFSAGKDLKRFLLEHEKKLSK